MADKPPRFNFHLSSDPIVPTVDDCSGDDRSRSVIVVVALDIRARCRPLYGLNGNTRVDFYRPTACSFVEQSIVDILNYLSISASCSIVLETIFDSLITYSFRILPILICGTDSSLLTDRDTY